MATVVVTRPVKVENAETSREVNVEIGAQDAARVRAELGDALYTSMIDLGILVEIP